MDPMPGLATTAVGASGLLILVLTDPCSIRVWLVPVPTAQQSEALMQATPARLLVSGVLGVVTIDHVLPFQCSARAGPYPTAQQSEAPMQATPVR